ncbi:ubiquitin-like protein 4A [Pomacea canaliculata]|uniref:ubiquitin-like protein 4A n=1 Tax=Pomacea canaliculata TaxID=400727 RepID=UPI000D73DD92|nr:ubiquitin-like protein 4A [Pomacea canaliculata]
MHISVKILNGQECTVAVSPSSLVSEVKEQVHNLLSVPVAEQKLLFRGKALTDEKLLKDYDIQDGTKLTLVVKKSSRDSPSPCTPDLASSTSLPPVWEKLHMFLRRHFREKDADLVLAEFRKNFEHGLSQLSLDDIDRLAATKIRQQQEKINLLFS